jgi:hypothetical protein
MTVSTQNQEASNSTTNPTATLKRFIRKAALPPGAATPPDEHACDVLVHGHNTSRCFLIRAHAQQTTANPAAAPQISDDRQTLSNEFENLDDGAPQYLVLSQDLDRALRLTPQSHETLLQSAQLVKR